MFLDIKLHPGIALPGFSLGVVLEDFVPPPPSDSWVKFNAQRFGVQI
jgi:hypothetical protein